MTQFMLKRIATVAVVLLAVNAMTYGLARYLDEWVFPHNTKEGALMILTFFDADMPEQPPQITTMARDYVGYLGGILRGDLGNRNNTPIMKTITDKLPKSLVLLGLSLLVASLLGILGGTLSVSTKTHQTTALAAMLTTGGYSIPAFYFTIALIALLMTFGPQMGRSRTLLPLNGYGLDEHLIIPTLALALRPAAEIARLTSEMLAEEMEKRYVLTARAKGLPWRLVILRHIFPNLAPAIVAMIGNSMRYQISSLVIIEWVFLWPGLGKTVIDTVAMNRGFMISGWHPLTMVAVISTLTLVALLASLLAQMITWVVDPRLREQHAPLAG
jgi:peptide/nickel transport system permease protein